MRLTNCGFCKAFAIVSMLGTSGAMLHVESEYASLSEPRTIRDRHPALDSALQDAAKREDVGGVMRLLQDGADPNAGRRRGMPVILTALGLDVEGKHDAYRVHTNPTTRHVEGTRAQTAIVSALVMRGANVNARSRHGDTPLMAAIHQGNSECAMLLITHKAKVNLANRLGLTALHAAASMHNEELIKILLDRRANVNARTISGWAPFMPNEYTTDGELRALLRGKPNLRLKDDKGETALMQARRLGRAAILRMLLDAGAKD